MRNFLLTTSALARVAALTGFAIGGMAFVGAKPALAEFEIQEPSVEKGEVETEYRGAVHFGIKKGEDDDNGAAENGDDDDDGGVIGALDDDELEAGGERFPSVENGAAIQRGGFAEQ